VLVKTVLGGFFIPSNRAELEHEVSLMVCCQLDLHINNRAHHIGLGDHFIPKVPPCFMMLWRGLIVRVATDSTFPTILPKLLCEASTENLVVIVVDRVDKPKPPH